jgi:hypothetical protein
VNDTEVFLKDVAALVVKSLPPDGSYDPNMRAAAVMGVVLALWKTRLHLAKTRDPNRPVAGRISSYASWTEYAQVMMSVMIDERDDAAFFAGQKWDLPFSVDAKDGEFV